MKRSIVILVSLALLLQVCVTTPAAADQARWLVEPDASDFDRWAQGSWDPSTVPTLSARDLRRVAGVFMAEGPRWIAAGGPDAEPRRRLQVATFVIEFLLTQDVAYPWPSGSPPSELLLWASSVASQGPATEAEGLWYLAGLGLLQRVGAPLGRHVQLALSRFPGEPRFILARALAEEQQTWPHARLQDRFVPEPQLWFRLLARYREAIAVPAVSAEAHIRLGHLELRRGRVPEAITLFDAAGAPEEAWLRFHKYLFLGQAHERRSDLVAAEQAYGIAFAAAPYAQSATVAWASTLARTGRAGEAAEVTSRMLQLDEPAPDPWLQFVPSEWRHFDTWMMTLRRLVR